MKRSYIFAKSVILAGCGKPSLETPATPTPEMNDGHPVVHLPPVETRPFEEGYTAGNEYGVKHATPHGKALAAEAARRQAVGQSDHWERGFAEGYADGVRKVVTGQK